MQPSTDVTVETWLSQTNYPEWRKQQLYDKYKNPKYQDFVKFINESTKVETFVKDESYSEYKYPRCINARSDGFKLLIGPVIKAIEKEVYKNPFFIKNVKIDERPDYIENNVAQPGCKVLATDHSFFEAHFERETMKNIEFRLYSYMTQFLPIHNFFMSIMNSHVAGINRLVSKLFYLYCVAIRMSGEMTTSLGNGFSNLMIMLFTAEEQKLLQLKGVVEGDDGAFTFYGKTPTSEWFQEIGFTIKMVEYESINEASFCGMLYEKYSRQVMTDIRKVILNFGWFSVKYIHSKQKILDGLLRCKALSMLYQYPACPIIYKLCRMIIRLTKDFIVIYKDDVYHRVQIQEALDSLSEKWDMKISQEPTIETRWFVMQKQNISIDLQLACEDYFDKQTQMHPITDPVFDFLRCGDAKHFYDNYVTAYDTFNYNHNVRVGRKTKHTNDAAKQKQETQRSEEEAGPSITASKQSRLSKIASETGAQLIEF